MHMMQGAGHLMLFAAFLFLAVLPLAGQIPISISLAARRQPRAAARQALFDASAPATVPPRHGGSALPDATSAACC
jgi:hypothetical protein